MMLEIEVLEDDDEAVSLVSQAVKYDSHVKRSDTHRSTIKRQVILVSLSVLIFLLITLVIKPFGFFSSEIMTISEQNNATENRKGALHDKYYPRFACPSEVQRAQNVDSESFEEVYSNVSRHIIQENVSSFLKNFRNEGFDGWGKKYDEVKGALYDWKAKHFAENLKDGDSLFESACGIGLNLLLTLEVVREVKQISNVKVYGNEYIAESVDLANEVLGTMLPNLNNAKETICQADSTDLSFIPSSAFDLVFTGYISTLLDPLNFNAGSMDRNYKLYEKICSTEKNDWKSKKLAEIAQQKQNDWFGLWISEMVRIAKPGAPVIIEQVSRPYCTDIDDWGGVPRSFFSTGITTYGWDVDPSSVTIEPDKVFGHRYHVFMRRNRN